MMEKVNELKIKQEEPLKIFDIHHLDGHLDQKSMKLMKILLYLKKY